jgi:hypothetical protein
MNNVDAGAQAANKDQQVADVAQENTDRQRKLVRFGAWVSGVWLIAISVILLVSAWRSGWATLSPNAVGDMLAGAFAPLALGWLVLGFLQQGEELRISSRALQQQADELKHSVEQQRALVAVALKEHEANIEVIRLERLRIAEERAIQRRLNQPLLTFRGVSFSGRPTDVRSQRTEIVNAGEGASEIRFQFTTELAKFDREGPDYLAPKGRWEAELSLAPGAEDGALLVSYVDRLGVPGTQRFKMVLDRGGFMQFRLMEPTVDIEKALAD